MTPLEADDPGWVGRYRLLARLGAGGMGVVFLGETPGGRKVAVKVIRPDYASGPDFRERFAREVAAAREVGGFHPAAVVDADPEADPPWMVTSYIPGQSLSAAVGEQGPLSLAAVRVLGAALAEGLAAGLPPSTVPPPATASRRSSFRTDGCWRRWRPALPRSGGCSVSRLGPAGYPSRSGGRSGHGRP